MLVLPVILAGGNGERLWPLSRYNFPKQFLSLFGKDSLLQQTISRLPKTASFYAPLVICQEQHRFVVAEQLRAIELKTAGIIIEPIGRNTAPAIAIAALWAKQNLPQAVLLVLPADHLIEDIDKFHHAINCAVDTAGNNKLVTFGIKPNKPETGYGYIKSGEFIDSNSYSIAEFIEKPNHDLAAQLLASNNYYWNSGMFVFKAITYLEELQQLQPNLYNQALISFTNKQSDFDFIRLGSEYKLCQSISIDNAVMEKTSLGAVVMLRANWSDIGSWRSIWENSLKDQDGNLLQGKVVCQNTKNCYVNSRKHLVATLGIQNIIVVATDDATLIMNKDQVSQLKDLVGIIKSEYNDTYQDPTKVSRPWGWYEVLLEQENIKVKRLCIKPKHKISLQLHNHRSEHWVVVQGRATVTKGETKFVLQANQSTYIPAKTKHRIDNDTNTSIEIIEVQTGNYVGEDDIIRFQDEYGRSKANEPEYS